MPGIAELALGAAPIAGGALLGAAAGTFKGPDVRAMIAKDMDLLERIPDDQPELKVRLKASIDERINDLIQATEKSRAIREAAVFLQRQLARHRRVHLCGAVHHHLVACEPQPEQLAGDVRVDDRSVGGRRDLRGPWRGACDKQFRAPRRRRVAEHSVVVGVRRRRNVRGVVDVVELGRLDAVCAGQIEDLVRAGDAGQV